MIIACRASRSSAVSSGGDETALARRHGKMHVLENELDVFFAGRFLPVVYYPCVKYFKYSKKMIYCLFKRVPFRDCAVAPENCRFKELYAGSEKTHIPGGSMG